jgi:hypothetical protein
LYAGHLSDAELSATAAANRDRLRLRLAEMLEDAVSRMERRGEPEPGHLTLIAGIAATLDVLERRRQRRLASNGESR